ncbi:damage-inducible protein DinB [Paenibacillus sp. CAA11]|uniref:DinB family protein n=1 Tax=Paenibacillus sp. CAA11 TaxID=1532905 RepID=UPI000D3399D8|nr:DinB family protein [Paenibacillus sp. CAA11]AWB43307.1 damage-inducible protein DinB [Paenibacillus sp. CAA11]
MSMNMNYQTKRLYEYHVWANQLVFAHLRKLPEEVWDHEVTSVFPSVSLLVSHIYAVDVMWLGVMKGSSFEEARALLMSSLQECKGASLESMEQRYAGIADSYRQFLSTCDAEKQIMITHPKSGSAKASIADMVQHVMNHGTYHRGNLTAMLRQSGHPGVPTDYAFYMFTE